MFELPFTKYVILPASLFAASFFDPEIIVPVTVALVGFVGTWLGIRQDRTEKRVTANDRLIDQLQEDAATAREYSAHLQRQVDQLTAEIHALRLDNGLKSVGIATLTQQLQSNGLSPMWQPGPHMKEGTSNE